METKILLFDDNPNVISFVQPALERAGYHVTTAGDGLEQRPIVERLYHLNKPGGRGRAAIPRT